MNNLSYFLRIGIVVGSILLISFLYPDSGHQKYHYDIGKSWDYEDLYAPKDFAILKDLNDVQAEKQNLIDNKELVFIKDEEVKDQVIIQVHKQIFNYLEEAKLDDNQDVLQRAEYWYNSKSDIIINKIFEKGIIDLQDSLATSEIKVVTLIAGNKSKSVILEELHSLATAKRQIAKDLGRIKFDFVDFLLPIIIDELIPNIVYDPKLSNDFLQEKLASIRPTKGIVKSGERIVVKEEIINKEINQKLLSYQKHFEEDTSQGASKWVLFTTFRTP